MHKSKKAKIELFCTDSANRKLAEFLFEAVANTCTVANDFGGLEMKTLSVLCNGIPLIHFRKRHQLAPFLD